MAEIDAAIAAAEARVLEQTGVLASAASGESTTAEKTLLASYLTSLDLLRMIRSQLLAEGRMPT